MTLPLHAPSLGFRPTHRIPVAERPDALAARLRRGLAEAAEPLEGCWAGSHAMLGLPRSRRHFWSPWVILDVRPDDDSDDVPADAVTSSTLVLRFSPHPNLWTFIALTYLALASTILFAGGFAWAQAVVGQTAWAGWVALGAALAAVLLWIAAQVGQSLARGQMEEIWAQVAAALGRADEA